MSDVQFTCPCYDVSGDSFRELVSLGVTDIKKIQEITGAGLGCGMCEDRMFMVIGEAVSAARNASPAKESGDA